MSAKCRICGKSIARLLTNGFKLPDGSFVCDTFACAEFAIGVVEAAREVVAKQGDAFLSDEDDVREVWDTINKLREALRE